MGEKKKCGFLRVKKGCEELSSQDLTWKELGLAHRGLLGSWVRF